MSPQLTDLLREMEQRTQQHGGVPHIAREAGQLLNLLVRLTHAGNILEVGVADGYGSLWLAEASVATGGMVTIIERDVLKAEMAREMIERSPHADRVHLIQGDPTELLAVMEGPYDFVLLDDDKVEALHQFRLIFEQVRSGGVICCDKAMSEAKALTDYLTYVHERPGLESILIPIGEGIEVTYKLP